MVHVLDNAPRELNGEYQYEFNFRTKHYGFSSGEGYWHLENGTALILGDGVYPEGTKAWEEVDFLLGIKLLRACLKIQKHSVFRPVCASECISS